MPAIYVIEPAACIAEWRTESTYVEADDIETEAGFLVFTRQTTVVDSPRRVVELRIPLAEVAEVREVS